MATFVIVSLERTQLYFTFITLKNVCPFYRNSSKAYQRRKRKLPKSYFCSELFLFIFLCRGSSLEQLRVEKRLRCVPQTDLPFSYTLTQVFPKTCLWYQIALAPLNVRTWPQTTNLSSDDHTLLRKILLNKNKYQSGFFGLYHRQASTVKARRTYEW